MGVGLIHNWDGTQSWTPEAIHHPQSEEEIVALIRLAGKTHKRVKVVGEALSWSDIIDIPTIIDLQPVEKYGHLGFSGVLFCGGLAWSQN